jgi:hypothetical protein
MDAGSQDITVRFVARIPVSVQAPVFYLAAVPNIGRAPPAWSTWSLPSRTPMAISRTDAINSLKPGLPSKVRGVPPAQAAHAAA